MDTHSLQTITTLILALAIGVLSMILARKLHVIPIVILLFAGIIVGPEVLGLINPSDLGETLEVLLQIGIAIILFEGALTLNYSEYKKVGGVIFKLLSLGILVTWLVNALVIFWLFSFPFTYALFLSSLIIVTGPTVIMPILRRINIKHNLTHILHWEGILVDPIGVFLAIFCFEILISGGETSILFNLFSRLGVGLLVGSVLGALGAVALNRRWVPQDLHNSFILMWALVIFGICNAISSESGLLGIVVSGIVLGIRKKVSLEEIKKFKFDLTEIFIAIIFILLSADINFTNIKRFFPEGLFLLLFITLFTRPLSIFICSLGSPMELKEKLFLSWIAPRGIIAASMVTLFSFSLKANTTLPQNIQDNLWFVETFVFAVITFTVVFQGSSAPLIAKVLGVKRDPSRNWVIVGAHALSGKIAEYLSLFNKNVVLLDSNKTKLDHYKRNNILVEHGDSLAYDIFNRENFIHAGRVLALTDNIELNELICQHWRKVVQPDGLFQWGGHVTTPYSDGAKMPYVWPHLAKPSILSEQITQEERSLIIKSPQDLSSLEKENAIPLMTVNNSGKVTFSPNLNDGTSSSLQATKWLFLLKENFSIIPFLKPEHIVALDKTVTTSQSLYTHLLDCLSPPLGIKTPETRQTLLESLQNQEKKETVCIGNQVSIFPTLQKTFTAPLIALFTTAVGIPLNAYDKKPIRIFFFIFAHNSDSIRYLSIISHISKIVTDKAVRTNLLEVSSTKELQNLVHTVLNEKNI